MIHSQLTQWDQARSKTSWEPQWQRKPTVLSSAQGASRALHPKKMDKGNTVTIFITQILDEKTLPKDRAS